MHWKATLNFKPFCSEQKLEFQLQHHWRVNIYFLLSFKKNPMKKTLLTQWVTQHTRRSKKVMPPTFYLLTFSFYFYGNNCNITELFKYFQSHSISHNCFTQQMAAPQLILMAEIDMWLQQQALIEFLVAEGSSQLAFMNIYSKCFVKLLWMWVLLHSGYKGLKGLKQEKKHFMANSGEVIVALQWMPQQHPQDW